VPAGGWYAKDVRMRSCKTRRRSCGGQDACYFRALNQNRTARTCSTEHSYSFTTGDTTVHKPNWARSERSRQRAVTFVDDTGSTTRQLSRPFGTLYKAPARRGVAGRVRIANVQGGSSPVLRVQTPTSSTRTTTGAYAPARLQDTSSSPGTPSTLSCTVNDLDFAALGADHKLSS